VDISSGRYDGLSQHKKEEIIKALDGIRILDPSVGEAVFLLTAGEWILNTRLSLGDTTEPQIIREQIVEDTLYGVDIQNEPIEQSAQSLYSWTYDIMNEYDESMQLNLGLGNSLIGKINPSDDFPDVDSVARKRIQVFDWFKNFPEVFNRDGGFDVIIGNPPYGNLLSQIEKEVLLKTSEYDTMSGREGTWNAACLFITRAYDLLNETGELGFLVPNSILRVGQFLKTRRFLLDPFNLWGIIDEGNPFDDVTLEMVSIFCSVGSEPEKVVGIHSRRSELMGSHSVGRNVFSSNQIYSIYHDAILTRIQALGSTGVLKATRGRDIPIANLNRTSKGEFRVPYATKGRSVIRYRVVEEHLRYSNDCFLDDSALSDSYYNEFLVATKNFPYPRCVVKPKGMIHGGGIVRIIPLQENYDIRAIGLILNSQLARYICTRYLTNYSQLTTCLNTGIISEFPIVYPDKPTLFAELFDLLQHAHSSAKDSDDIAIIEATANALVYSLYFPLKSDSNCIHEVLQGFGKHKFSAAVNNLSDDNVQSEVNATLNQSIVRKISASPRMN
jgi:hypothetical protein